MTTLFEIYLRKSLKVVLPDEATNFAPSLPTKDLVMTASRNLHSLGFGLSETLVRRLSSLSESQVVSWYESTLPILKQMVGAHREFLPMYPNFPSQVMEASDSELYFNAMIHYFGFQLADAIEDASFVVLPRYEKKARKLFDEFQELRWIDLGSEADLDQLFTRIAGSNGSLSDFDKEALRCFVNQRNVTPLLPKKIPQKETLAFLAAILPDSQCLQSQLKGATDILRVAVAMSDGDVSLAEPVKFRNFSKKERRFFLGCLERLKNPVEDMLRWKPRWIRLGERLHPGDYKSRFPNAFAAFDLLRNDKPYETFNRQVETAIAAAKIEETLPMLKSRPGDFARRLDHVLRTHDSQDEIVRGFLAVADMVSTPVLLQAWKHFEIREQIVGRAFFPKGNAAKVRFQDGALPQMKPEIAEATATGIRKVLVTRFAKLVPLGRTFIDERLRTQFVPFALRSASRTLRTIARGSSFELPPGDTVRFFCWWKNIDAADEWKSRVDLDLAAAFFGDDWQSKGQIAYYNLRADECFHSGDITSAPDGACEFIDIHLPSLANRDVRYVVMSVHSYTRQPFLALPECFGGWMIRQHPNSGEIFEARSVLDKIDITSGARVCIPVILDAKSRRMIWTDLGLTSATQINNAAANLPGLTSIGRAITELQKPTLFELLQMHAEARGEIVGQKMEADTVFDLYSGDVTAFEASKIMSEFLA